MWLVGGIYVVWLPCIGVVSGCCCVKEIYRYPLTIITNFPYSTCISFFLAAASLLLVHFKNVFSVFKNKNKNKKLKWQFFT